MATGHDRHGNEHDDDQGMRADLDEHDAEHANVLDPTPSLLFYKTETLPPSLHNPNKLSLSNGRAPGVNHTLPNHFPQA